MIEKQLIIAASHEDADRIARQQDNERTCLERLADFMTLIRR